MKAKNDEEGEAENAPTTPKPLTKNSKLKVIMNPNFDSMSEQEKRRTISIDKSYLDQGENGRIEVLQNLCNNYITKSFQPSLDKKRWNSKLPMMQSLSE